MYPDDERWPGRAVLKEQVLPQHGCVVGEKFGTRGVFAFCNRNGRSTLIRAFLGFVIG